MLTLTIAIVVGLLVGLALGGLGGGGSVLTVPALVYLLGQSPQAATSGSLVVVGLAALTGVLAHGRAGRVRVGQGLAFALLAVGGTLAGARASTSVDPNLLLGGFGLLMVVVAVAMLREAGAQHAAGRPAALATRSAPGAAAGAGPPLDVSDHVAPAPRVGAVPGRRPDAARVGRLVVGATAVGLLTGFFGVGGGFLVVPTLVLVLGLQLRVAVGTSLLVIAVTSSTALLMRMGHHVALDWGVVVPFAGAAVVGAWSGQRWAAGVDRRRLQKGFAVLLLLVAVATIAGSLASSG